MWRFLRQILQRFLRDVRFLSALVPALVEIRRVARSASRSGSRPWTSLSFWNGAVEKYGDRPALIFGNDTYSFAAVDRISNRFGRTALQMGFKPGRHTVAILMENRPEYIFLMLGLAKIGVEAALLNTNVVGEGLLRCIHACGAKHVLFSHEMAPVVASLPDNADSKCLSFVLVGNGNGQGQSLDSICGKRCDIFDLTTSEAPIPPGLRKNILFTDTMLHIFTSGTTGLPKAAKISHLRFFGSSLIISRLIRLKRTDRIYCPLPFYHSSSIVLGLGLCLHNGLPFISRKKFSASEFWEDCVKHRVTIVQYIGELCRYLCSSPQHPDENRHSVRMALGNGLRPDVWVNFVDRFTVPKVVEFYAATEGNVGLLNTENKVGAVGFLSPLLARKHPGKILRYDFSVGAPFRDRHGRCIETSPGECGEFVGMINRKDITQRFDGYSEEAETAKKVLKDVFEVGDECFRSGDLMKKDDDGFIYFVDRIGDTFRWKGENVSTTEVEGALQLCKGINDCVVYGVSIDGYEGKAGMALISVDDTKDLPLHQTYTALSCDLPSYARPLFFRFTREVIDATATFKHQKQRLVKEGFDPNRIPSTEKLFLNTCTWRSMPPDGIRRFEMGGGTEGLFLELTSDLYQQIITGEYLL